jgi:DNA-3-methyladenine glycosylase I
VDNVRCAWVNLADELYVKYHDTEWGVPVRDDRALFERITLEGAQAGLSWITVLRKRARYREVFAGFDPQAVARFDNAKVEALLTDPGIIRNRAKILATVNNAARFMEVQARYGSFSTFLWDFVDGRTIQNSWRSLSDVPAETDTSRRMSKALLTMGFKFVGPTICYAMMQACGLVNDHTTDCFRHAELAG